MDLQDLSSVIDGLAGEDPTRFADGDSVVALHRQLARLDALLTAVTAKFDTSRDWAADGARSASAWTTARCGISSAESRRRVRLGRELAHLPDFAKAWTDGDITAEHVTVMARAHTPTTEEALERDQALLAGEAKQLRFRDFARLVAYWEQLADPDGTEERAEARHARRDVTLSDSFEGMYLGTITLDPVSGSIVAGELARLEKQHFDTDWAEARARLGNREPTLTDLARTPNQRRADALVEMATRSAAAPPDARRPNPLFTVLVDYETLAGRTCELADGTVITPGQLLPWLDRADVERAVFTPDQRVEIGQRDRLFTGATRRAVQIRDHLSHHGCTHPYCDERPDRCQVDHIIPYAAGGPTTQTNGRLLCGHHNRQREHRTPSTG